MQQTKEGSLLDTSLFRMTWPIFVELILQMLVGNMDQIMLSHYNQTAVAAVGNANQIMTILILTFNVTSLASTILISQYLGARDPKNVSRIYTLSVLVNGIVSLVLAAGLFLFAGPILSLMQAPVEVRPEAMSYLRITALSLPFQALMLTFSAFLRAHAKMLVIMLSTGLINLINIVGNTAFIYGIGPLPQMGAAGAAVSTTLCRIVGMLMLLGAFYRSVEGEKIRVALLRPFPTDLLKRLLGIGLPSGGEGLSYNLSQATSLVFVNMIGTYAITARMYSVMFAQVCYMLISAVSQAGQIRIGYCIGARDFDRADRENKHILKTFAPITVGIAILLCICSRFLYGLFSDDIRVIELGSQILFIEIFLEIGRSFNIVLVRNLQAVGDVKFPVTVGIISQWVIAVGLCYFLGIHLNWGLPGMWLSFALDENIRGIIFALRWKSGKWRNIKTV